MYLFPDEAAHAAAAARMRVAIGLPVSESATPWAQSVDDSLARAESLWDAWRSDALVSLHFAPQAAHTLDDAALVRVRRVADELDARIAMPVHETDMEVQDSLARHGRRPLRRLADLGLLRPGFAAVHANRLDDDDLELLHDTGSSVVACLQSNLRLGNGGCAVAALRQAGVAVALGTDSPASAGAFDLLAEARLAALLSQAPASGRPLAAHEALRMATLAGAQVLGLAEDIGSIEPGKAADLVCVDLDDPMDQPPGADPVERLVWTATRQQVADVWIAGRAVVAAGRLLAFDEMQLARTAREWGERLGVTQ
jgi:5-methylthioadenosine/S-adenosylhomocysteine deaminase